MRSAFPNWNFFACYRQISFLLFRMTDSSLNSRMNRRRFLATTGMALAGPAIFTSSAATSGKRIAANERITMGVVGWGMMGPGNTAAFLGNNDCHVVAACDLD